MVLIFCIPFFLRQCIYEVKLFSNISWQLTHLKFCICVYWATLNTLHVYGSFVFKWHWWYCVFSTPMRFTFVVHREIWIRIRILIGLLCSTTWWPSCSCYIHHLQTHKTSMHCSPNACCLLSMLEKKIIFSCSYDVITSVALNTYMEHLQVKIAYWPYTTPRMDYYNSLWETWVLWPQWKRADNTGNPLQTSHYYIMSSHENPWKASNRLIIYNIKSR